MFDRTRDPTHRGNRHRVGNLDALADAELATDAAIAADAGRARDGCLTGDRTTCANHRMMSDQHLAVEHAPLRDDGVTQHTGVNYHVRKDRIVDHQCVALALCHAYQHSASASLYAHTDNETNVVGYSNIGHGQSVDHGIDLCILKTGPEQLFDRLSVTGSAARPAPISQFGAAGGGAAQIA